MKKMYFLLISIPFILLSCQEENKTTENKNIENELSPEIIHQNATADNKIQNTGIGAKFNFESEVHDFGTVKHGEKATYTFRFTNEGDAELVIADAKPGCGCTVPNFSNKPLKPGESGFIDVTYNSATRPPGRFSQTVTVTANTEPNTVYLRVTGDVIE